MERFCKLNFEVNFRCGQPSLWKIRGGNVIMGSSLVVLRTWKDTKIEWYKGSIIWDISEIWMLEGEKIDASVLLG